MATSTETYQDHSIPDNDAGIVDMTIDVQIPAGIAIAVLIVVGSVGNILIILAYFMNHKLRTVHNFFILNLAITDLLLCVFSMPFYAVYTLKKFTWPFGLAFCKVWNVIDFTCCFQSIQLMVILSIDVLLMIVQGPTYFVKITIKKARIVVGVSWLTAFLVYGPCIIGWNYWAGYSIYDKRECGVEFAHSEGYTTATAIVESTLPFVFLTSINAIIYFKIRQRRNWLLKENQETNSSSTDTNVSRVSVNKHKIESNLDDEKDIRVLSMRNRETKAAKQLALLFVAFLICWGPYTSTTVWISFFDSCINISLYEFFTWIVWIKSAVNPFLYAFNRRQFRIDFRRMLTCTCERKAVSAHGSTYISSTVASGSGHLLVHAVCSSNKSINADV